MSKNVTDPLSGVLNKATGTVSGVTGGKIPADTSAVTGKIPGGDLTGKLPVDLSNLTGVLGNLPDTSALGGLGNVVANLGQISNLVSQIQSAADINKAHDLAGQVQGLLGHVSLPDHE